MSQMIGREGWWLCCTSQDIGLSDRLRNGPMCRARH